MRNIETDDFKIRANDEVLDLCELGRWILAARFEVGHVFGINEDLIVGALRAEDKKQTGSTPWFIDVTNI